MDDSGRGKRRDTRVRIGRWKETVSSVQRARKKMYCSKIGWVARKLGVVPAVADEFRPDAVPLARLLGLGGNGGGGESGRAGEDGVAFSMRAQVR